MPDETLGTIEAVEDVKPGEILEKPIETIKPDADAARYATISEKVALDAIPVEEITAETIKGAAEASGIDMSECTCINGMTEKIIAQKKAETSAQKIGDFIAAVFPVVGFEGAEYEVTEEDTKPVLKIWLEGK